MLPKFQKFLDEFKVTKLWTDMEATCENSPWHRESSVSKHVEMILDHYFENFAQHRTDRQQALTFLSVVFHDTGKPSAAKTKTSESRGTYTSFGGHEHKSARLWEEYAVENWNKWKQLKKTFGLKDSDIYVISWIIENHLPHDLDTPEDLQHIRNQLDSEPFEFGELANVYYDQIISDQSGRISDDHEKNLAEVFAFVDGIKKLKANYSLKRSNLQVLGCSAPKLYVLIGASGSGKSTYSDKKIKDGASYFSLDASRLSYAADNGVKGSNPVDAYGRAFAYCGKHRGPFRQYADRIFRDLVKSNVSIIVDNTNVSSDARGDYIYEAKKSGYDIVCVLFPITRKELAGRQKAPTDKCVPMVAVMDQYSRISMPWLGKETDYVELVMTNVDGQTKCKIQ